MDQPCTGSRGFFEFVGHRPVGQPAAQADGPTVERRPLRRLARLQAQALELAQHRRSGGCRRVAGHQTGQTNEEVDAAHRLHLLQRRRGLDGGGLPAA
jgi:hypothetical protein